MRREETHAVTIGTVKMGGGAPVTVQSMTTTDTRDPASTGAQIAELVQAGCDIVRVAVPDAEAAAVLPEICSQASVPLVADIHFDYRLALAAIDAGIDKIRINPGNIGAAEKVREVAAAARDHGLPIRIGVNAGSLDKALHSLYAKDPAAALVESGCREADLLEKEGFRDIVISLKTHDISICVAAYRAMAQKRPYPLHLGITEAGPARAGTITSAIGIGAMLLDGIGDTLRVSLTAPPTEEVGVGLEIVRALGLRNDRPRLVSCPTCGRCRVNLIGLAAEVEKKLETIRKPLTVAVMGCEVNGPGEAKEADLGVAGGKGCGILFKKGKIIRKVPENEVVSALLAEVEKWDE